MIKNPLMEQLRSEISAQDKALMDDSFALSNRIAYLLKKHKISQKELAHKLHKRESEISKWLSGGHNFTQQTLTKISLAIGESIYEIPAARESRTRVESLTIFKAAFSKLVKLTEVNKKGFKAYSVKEISSLSVSATGIICTSPIDLEKDNFTIATMNKKDFKNIEKTML